MLLEAVIERFLEGQIKSLNLIVFSCSLLYMFWWLYLAISFYSPNSITWENLNFNVKIVIPCIYVLLSITCTNRDKQLHDWFKEKKNYSQLSSNCIISLLLQQNCLPHSILLLISNKFTLVHCEKVTVPFLGGQQLEIEHFPQIYEN